MTAFRGAPETTFSIPLTLGMSAIGFPIRGGKEHSCASSVRSAAISVHEL